MGHPVVSAKISSGSQGFSRLTKAKSGSTPLRFLQLRFCLFSVTVSSFSISYEVGIFSRLFPSRTSVSAPFQKRDRTTTQLFLRVVKFASASNSNFGADRWPDCATLCRIVGPLPGLLDLRPEREKRQFIHCFEQKMCFITSLAKFGDF